jgi:hypothetical protein
VGGSATPAARIARLAARRGAERTVKRSSTTSFRQRGENGVRPSCSFPDAADRASIVAALERQLAKGDKALVGNTGDTPFSTDNIPQHFSPQFFGKGDAMPISLTHRVTDGNAW